jgi:DNA replication protein DnaC
MIYPDCHNCVATPFCKLYSGEVKSRHTDWCRAKFRLDDALKKTGLPKRYRNANLFNFTVDEYNEKAHREISENIEKIVDMVDAGENFFLHGYKPGTGKTYLAACLLNHYIYKACMVTGRYDFENPLAMFVMYPDLMDDLRYTRDDDRVKNKVADIMTVPLLLLDDVGAGTFSDFVREQTFKIINNRLNLGLSTIITSNYPLKQLAADNSLGMRNVSRLLQDTNTLELLGNDRRRA